MRVLLVGGIPKRIHHGPVDWAGHRFEAVRHAFDRIVIVEHTKARESVTLDREALADFVESTRDFDAVFCETPEAMLLFQEWKRRGDSPKALLALDVHGLERVAAMRKWYLEHDGRDPWPEMTRAPWIAWIAASSSQAQILFKAGVPRERISRINAGTIAYSTFVPNADVLLDGGPEVDGEAAFGLPADGIVVPGSGRRDPECSLEAARALPDLPFAVVDEQAAGHRRRLAGTGLLELPNVRWLRALALERYIALIKRARLVVVALQPGTGDGGHTTVALAHRLGAAVICSHVPGIADYVEDGYNARLVKAADSDGLAEAIRDLWQDADERRRLAQNGRLTEVGRARECRQGFLQTLESVAANISERAE
ncbi:MAG TPA: glycosyltransferase [Myxococcota bacterium]|nr:glycosyltransferase [Myxococcota bacterium]